jgi:mannose-1-phosphate guanylyltransferase
MAVGATWALVLAAGEGSRLRSLTTKPCGTAVPKQFCSLKGERTLLEEALARARAVTTTQHICTIVAEQHEAWWRSLLGDLPQRNVIPQPRNRGTAIGILYPLLRILARDPHARLVILPSDHYVQEELVLRRSMHAALQALVHWDGAPILLGIEPYEPDPELGYIIPGAYDRYGTQSILHFVEKPPANIAGTVIERGGLWNAFIVVACGQSLLNLFEQSCPAIVRELRNLVTQYEEGLNVAAALSALYERLPQMDFSREVLQAHSSALRVARVPACGWSDLGTPKRVAETLRCLGSTEIRARHVSTREPPVNLASQYARFQRMSIQASGV